MAATRKPRWIDPFEERQIRRLVAEFGSPLLIIDCERVSSASCRRRCRAWTCTTR